MSMDMEFARASAMMLGINLVYAVVGFLISVIAILIVDKIFLKKICLQDEIKKGNIAAAIFAAALILGAVMAVSKALGK
jgi:uncharacterized membrane protein YjfL (UPF0719 family)